MKRSEKVTQRQAILFHLYRQRKNAVDHEMYIPVWKMIGEVFVPEVGLWGFVSYEVSARMSEMFKENPGLFERVMMKGKTGAQYYGYRIALNAKPSDIVEKDLKEFYSKIKS